MVDEDHYQDPTELTTAQLHREIAGLHTEVVLLVEALREVVDERWNFAHERFDHMNQKRDMADTATKDSLAAIDREIAAALTATDKAVAAALAAVDKQLAFRDHSDADRHAATDREWREHLEQARHETALAFEASDRAITKAEIATEKRFESLNSFRAQLSDMARESMPRTEADAAFHRQSERITELTDRMNRASGGEHATETSATRLRATLQVGIGVSAVVISLVVVLVNILLR